MNSRTITAITAAALTFAATSCSPAKQEHTFLQDAVLSHLKEAAKTPFDESTFVFTEWDITDTVTRREEIDRSIDAYGKACDMAKKRRDTYRKAGKRKNARREDSTVVYTGKVVEKLCVYRDLMKEGGDSTLYYCIRFSGYTLGRGPRITCNATYATITPNGEVVKMQNSASRLKQGMGVLLSGYETLLESCRP